MFAIRQQHAAVRLLQEKAPPETRWVLHHQPSSQWPGPDSVTLPHGDNVKLLSQVLQPTPTLAGIKAEKCKKEKKEKLVLAAAEWITSVTHITYVIGKSVKSFSFFYIYFMVHWAAPHGWLAEWLPVHLWSAMLTQTFLSPPPSPSHLIDLSSLCFCAVLFLFLTLPPSYAGGCMGKLSAPCTRFVACCLASAVWPLSPC